MKTFEYRTTFFTGTALRAWAFRYLEVLPKDVTGLISRGSSGCTIASAMLALSKRPLSHYYIRQSQEQGHNGHGPAGRIGDGSLAIVDDFVDTGVTIQAILADLSPSQLVRVKYIIVHHNYSDYAPKTYDAEIPIICVEAEA